MGTCPKGLIKCTCVYLWGKRVPVVLAGNTSPRRGSEEPGSAPARARQWRQTAAPLVARPQREALCGEKLRPLSVCQGAGRAIDVLNEKFLS